MQPRGVIGRAEEDGFPVSRTGNGSKELIYYMHDRDAFPERLNGGLDGRPRYPIDITFCHDPDWQEFAITRALRRRSRPRGPAAVTGTRT